MGAPAREHFVGELAGHVGVQPPGVSRHLARLRMAPVVKVSSEDNTTLDAAESAHILRLVEEAPFHSDHVAGMLPAR